MSSTKKPVSKKASKSSKSGHAGQSIKKPARVRAVSVEPKPPTAIEKAISRKKETFIAELRKSGVVGLACKRSGLGRSTAYEQREADREFRKAWQMAQEDALDALYLEAIRRGRDGVLVPTTVAGKRVNVRQYDTTSLIYMMNKAERDKRFKATIKALAENTLVVIKLSGQAMNLTEEQIKKLQFDVYESYKEVAI